MAHAVVRPARPVRSKSGRHQHRDLAHQTWVEAGAVEGLFARFDAELKNREFFALSDQMIDASIVEAPKQRVSEDEKARIKAGETARQIWPGRPAKAAHKDTAARCTVKRGRKKPKPGRNTMERTVEGLMIPVFGYYPKGALCAKNHVNVDRRYRLIRRWTVSHADDRRHGDSDPAHVVCHPGGLSAVAPAGVEA